MDRIIITDHKLFLQKEPIRRLGKLVEFKQVELLTVEQSEEIQQKVNELRTLLEPLFNAQQKPLQEEISLISEPISPDPADSSITRTANCALPIMTNHSEFQLPVLIKHFDSEGTYLPERDRVVTLIADNKDGEFEQLKAQIEYGANFFTLTREMLAYRDTPAGGNRFN